MKDAYYFSHDSNARNDQRLMKVRMKYGPEGYGIYFMIIEILRDTENYSLNINDIESICFDIRAKNETVLDILKNFNLFVFEGDFFYSNSLSRRMEKLDKIKEIRRASGKKGATATAKVRQKLKGETANDVPNAEQVEYIKEDKNTVNNNKEKKKKQVMPEIPLSLSFDLFWDIYDYKQLRPDCEDIWTGKKKTKRGITFNDDIRQKIMDHLPLYVENTHKDGEYPPRKHPKTYLNNNGWEDEVVVAEALEKPVYKHDSCGFPMAYCEACGISDSYREEELSGDSKCCHAKLLATKPKKISNNGRHQGLVEQSKKYRRFIDAKNSRQKEPTEIGQILGQTLEKLEPIAEEEEAKDGQ